MVKFIGFNGSQLCSKFFKNELISFGPVIVIKNEGMTKVNRVWRQIGDKGKWI